MIPYDDLWWFQIEKNLWFPWFIQKYFSASTGLANCHYVARQSDRQGKNAPGGFIARQEMTPEVVHIHIDRLHNRIVWMQSDLSPHRLYTVSRCGYRGGHSGRAPTPFCPKFCKKSPKLAKKVLGAGPEATTSPPFSNPGSAPGFCLVPISIHVERQSMNFWPALVNPLTAGAVYIWVFSFISTLSTTF